VLTQDKLIVTKVQEGTTSREDDPFTWVIQHYTLSFSLDDQVRREALTRMGAYLWGAVTFVFFRRRPGARLGGTQGVLEALQAEDVHPCTQGELLRVGLICPQQIQVGRRLIALGTIATFVRGNPSGESAAYLTASPCGGKPILSLTPYESTWMQQGDRIIGIQSGHRRARWIEILASRAGH